MKSVAFGTTYVTGSFFEWGAGLSPLEIAAAKKEAQLSSEEAANQLRYQTSLTTFQTGASAVSQNYYSSFSNTTGRQPSYQQQSSGASSVSLSNVFSQIRNFFTPSNGTQYSALQSFFSAFGQKY